MEHGAGSSRRMREIRHGTAQCTMDLGVAWTDEVKRPGRACRGMHLEPIQHSGPGPIPVPIVSGSLISVSSWSSLGPGIDTPASQRARFSQCCSTERSQREHSTAQRSALRKVAQNTRKKEHWLLLVRIRAARTAEPRQTNEHRQSRQTLFALPLPRHPDPSHPAPPLPVLRLALPRFASLHAHSLPQLHTQQQQRSAFVQRSAFRHRTALHDTALQLACTDRVRTAWAAHDPSQLAIARHANKGTRRYLNLDLYLCPTV